MPKRQHICDVPDCKMPRKRWQRLCEHHYRTLPFDIRNGIVAAFKQRRRADHTAWKKSAASWLKTATASGITSQQSYQQTAKLLGERTE